MRKVTDPKRPYEVKAEEIDTTIDKQMDYFTFKNQCGSELRQMTKDYLATMKRLKMQDEIDRKIRNQYKDMRLELVIIIKKYLTQKRLAIEVADWGQIRYRTRKIMPKEMFDRMNLDAEEKLQKWKSGQKMQLSDSLIKKIDQIKIFATMQIAMADKILSKKAQAKMCTDDTKKLMVQAGMNTEAFSCKAKHSVELNSQGTLLSPANTQTVGLSSRRSKEAL